MEHITKLPADCIEITDLSHDGRGVGRNANGKTIFIDGVLPGETVTYEVKQQKRRFNIAQAIDVLTPAPERVTAKCQHFLLCGGCSQQHINTSKQIESKQHSLIEQLQHFGNVAPKEILEPLTGPQWGYRTKARLGVRYVHKKDKVLVGFREKHSNFLAEIDSCAILHPKVAQLILPLQSFIRSLTCYRDIAQLEVAIGGDHLAIIVRHLQALSEQDLQAWIDFAKQHVFDLYLQPKGPDSVIKIWPQDNDPRLHYSLTDHKLEFAFHPTDFTQVNTTINAKMIAQALTLLQVNPSDNILDLFCGLGNFTLPLAQHAKHVTGVEGSESMVERGFENATRNNIANVSFYAADLTKDQSAKEWAKHYYRKVLLDPPRSGAAEVLPWLAKIKPQQILYVSCNPATLARDCGTLVNNYGYTLKTTGIMDMFPHTMHVEAMALLEL